jgi:hypothetical protein
MPHVDDGMMVAVVVMMDGAVRLVIRSNIFAEDKTQAFHRR